MMIVSLLPSSADNVLFIDDFEMDKNDEKWVEIKLQNTDLIANLQMSLILPLGLHVSDVTCGDYLGTTLPNKWDTDTERDMGSSWEIRTNESDGLYNIMLVSGIARYKNEGGVVSDFGLQNPFDATPIMKILFYADETFTSGNIYFFNCIGAAINQLSIPVDGNDVSVTTSIDDVKQDKMSTGTTIYNVVGQKVNDGYKGMIISNGKVIIKK